MEEEVAKASTLKLEWFFADRIHLENMTKSLTAFKRRAEVRFAVKHVTLSEPINRVGGKYVAELMFNEKVDIKEIIYNVLHRKGSKATFEIKHKDLPLGIDNESIVISTPIIEYKSASNTSGLVSNIYLNISNIDNDITMTDVIANRESIEKSIAIKVKELSDALLFFNQDVDRLTFERLTKAIELFKQNDEELTVYNLYGYCYTDIEYPVFTKLVEMYLKYIN